MWAEMQLQAAEEHMERACLTISDQILQQSRSAMDVVWRPTSDNQPNHVS